LTPEASTPYSQRGGALAIPISFGLGNWLIFVPPYCSSIGLAKVCARGSGRFGPRCIEESDLPATTGLGWEPASSERAAHSAVSSRTRYGGERFFFLSVFTVFYCNCSGPIESLLTQKSECKGPVHVIPNGVPTGQNGRTPYANLRCLPESGFFFVWAFLAFPRTRGVNSLVCEETAGPSD